MYSHVKEETTDAMVMKKDANPIEMTEIFHSMEFCFLERYSTNPWLVPPPNAPIPVIASDIAQYNWAESYPFARMRYVNMKEKIVRR